MTVSLNDVIDDDGRLDLNKVTRDNDLSIIFDLWRLLCFFCTSTDDLMRAAAQMNISLPARRPTNTSAKLARRNIRRNELIVRQRIPEGHDTGRGVREINAPTEVCHDFQVGDDNLFRFFDVDENLLFTFKIPGKGEMEMEAWIQNEAEQAALAFEAGLIAGREKGRLDLQRQIAESLNMRLEVDPERDY